MAGGNWGDVAENGEIAGARLWLGEVWMFGEVGCFRGAQ